MDDLEYIEKYLRGDLTEQQAADFEARVSTDETFRRKYEVEKVIVRSLQFSQEKQRIRALVSAEAPAPQSQWDWLLGSRLVMLIGLAMAAWLLSTVLSGLLPLPTPAYKWMGLGMAMIVSFMAILSTRKRLDFKLATIGLANGIVIFISSSGIDAINQGINMKSDQTTAVLIPYTQKTVWWPTQSLVDSVTEQNKTNRKLAMDNAELVRLIQMVRDSCFQSAFDSIVPVVVPYSNVVASGGLFKGRVFVAASSNRKELEIYANGKRLNVHMDSTLGIMVGDVVIPALAGRYDADDRAKQSFTTEIRVPGRNPMKRVVEYAVVRPTIRISNGSTPSLYMNCGNFVNIEVPALGVDYNPSFTIKGGTLSKGDMPGKVTIIPKERRVAVTVYNRGAIIGTEYFDVKPIPRPHYVARDGSGREIDLKNGIRAAGLNGLYIYAEPEDNFRTDVPKDALYRIRAVEVILARGTARVDQFYSTSENLDFNRWKSQMRAGDRIIIDIIRVTRKTFTGEEVPVAVSSGTINIPIQ